MGTAPCIKLYALLLVSAVIVIWTGVEIKHQCLALDGQIPNSDNQSAQLTGESATQDGWFLVWNDEFNAPDGTPPDSSKWVCNIGRINAEEYDTDSTRNCFQQNGQLVIRAIREDYGGCHYTSAFIKTRGKFSQAYGRFEARIKIPCGQGLWPAFWLAGAKGKWPFCGEVDIVENLGKYPSKIYSGIHGPAEPYGRFNSTYSLKNDAIFADDYHVYAVEWDATQIKWYCDGINYYTVTKEQLVAANNWVFDKPFIISLDLFVGGDWGGSPDNTTLFPADMYVDYVRVYKKN